MSRVVVMHWYADLYLRHGGMVPMRLWGGNVTDALTEAHIDDNLSAQIEGLFNGSWTDDNGTVRYHGEAVPAVEIDENGTETVRFVRRSEITYATLRKQLIEED
jgi:hypothetical protein